MADDPTPTPSATPSEVARLLAESAALWISSWLAPCPPQPTPPHDRATEDGPSGESSQCGPPRPRALPRPGHGRRFGRAGLARCRESAGPCGLVDCDLWRDRSVGRFPGQPGARSLRAARRGGRQEGQPPAPPRPRRQQGRSLCPGAAGRQRGADERSTSATGRREARQTCSIVAICDWRSSSATSSPTWRATTSGAWPPSVLPSASRSPGRRPRPS